MVTGNRSATLAATMTLGDHTLISGLDPKIGGLNEGPNPHQLVEAALAACTILTVQMYANRKNMKLESTEVTVKIISEVKDATVIQRDVKFIGDLNSEERARLIEIADKCPIHKLLTSTVTIQTSVTAP